MVNEAIGLAELHINMIYEQHSTHLETCAYVVVITFLHARIVDKLTSTVRHCMTLCVYVNCLVMSHTVVL